MKKNHVVLAGLAIIAMTGLGAIVFNTESYENLAGNVFSDSVSKPLGGRMIKSDPHVVGKSIADNSLAKFSNDSDVTLISLERKNVGSVVSDSERRDDVFSQEISLESVMQEVKTSSSSQQTVQGRLIVSVLEPKNKSASTTVGNNLDYVVENSAGELIRLDLSSGDILNYKRSLIPDAQVQISGNQMTSSIMNNIRMVKVLSLPSATDITYSSRSTLPSKKLAVIMFNFQDDQSLPLTQEQVRSAIFLDQDSLRGYLERVSYGKQTVEGVNNIDGDIYGWVTVPFSKNNGCGDYYDWGNTANNLAAPLGFNASQYTNIMYIFPSVPNCSWGGLANVGVLGSQNLYRSWIPVSVNNIDKTVIAHEFGHNLGLWHAGSADCLNQSGTHISLNFQAGQTCMINSYGDQFDAMGASTVSGFNDWSGFSKERLGYISGSNVVISGNGIYNLYSTQTSSANIQVIRIPLAVDVNGNVVEYYNLEYRTSSQFQGQFVQSNGVQIRITQNPFDTLAQRTYLVDTSPGSRTGSFAEDHKDAFLQSGGSFIDTKAGISINVTAMNNQYATVQISSSTNLCIRRQPTLTVTPLIQTNRPGKSVNYSVNLKNSDSVNCRGSQYYLHPPIIWQLPNSQINPPGWLSSLSSVIAMNIDPQQIDSRIVSVTSPTNAVSGANFNVKFYAEAVSFLENFDTANMVQYKVRSLLDSFIPRNNNL